MLSLLFGGAIAVTEPIGWITWAANSKLFAVHFASPERSEVRLFDYAGKEKQASDLGPRTPLTPFYLPVGGPICWMGNRKVVCVYPDMPHTQYLVGVVPVGGRPILTPTRIRLADYDAMLRFFISQDRPMLMCVKKDESVALKQAVVLDVLTNTIKWHAKVYANSRIDFVNSQVSPHGKVISVPERNLYRLYSPAGSVIGSRRKSSLPGNRIIPVSRRDWVTWSSNQVRRFHGVQELTRVSASFVDFQLVTPTLGFGLDKEGLGLVIRFGRRAPTVDRIRIPGGISYEKSEPQRFAVSPDGTMLAYIDKKLKVRTLRLRSIARVLPRDSWSPPVSGANLPDGQIKDLRQFLSLPPNPVLEVPRRLSGMAPTI